MYNNVFINANYAWAFHVTNNKLLDDAVNADQQRWARMSRDWFLSGRPYREIDAIDCVHDTVVGVKPRAQIPNLEQRLRRIRSRAARAGSAR